MTDIGFFKVIEDDSQYEDEASHPARVWRTTEAECEAWIAEVGHRHPFQVALGYITVGPYEATYLPFVVIDRSAPAGEDRILERYANAEEARLYVDIMERFSMLETRRPHYGIVSEHDLAAALEVPSTRLLPGDPVKVGTAKRNAVPWYPELSNFEADVVVRTVETALGAVNVRMYPSGQLRVSAGHKAGQDSGVGPILLPDMRGARGSVAGSVAFDAILDLRGNEATLAGLRRTVHDAADRPTEEEALVALADRQVFSVARAAAQGMASDHPHDRLEALGRHHARLESAARHRIHDLQRKLREAESSLKLHAGGKVEVARALEAEVAELEPSAPSPR